VAARTETPLSTGFPFPTAKIGKNVLRLLPPDEFYVAE
jgi:hypothetical protein